MDSSVDGRDSSLLQYESSLELSSEGFLLGPFGGGGGGAVMMGHVEMEKIDPFGFLFRLLYCCIHKKLVLFLSIQV